MEYPVLNCKQEAAPSASWVRCIASVIAAVVMLVVCWPGIAQASTALDDWRASVARVRKLAENDVPRASQEAQRLQTQLAAEATPADQASVLNLRARAEVYSAQPDAAANHADQALALAAGQADRVGQAEAYLNMALNAVNLGKISLLVDAAPRALEVLQGVDRPDLLGEAMLRVAMLYLRMGQLDESITLCLQAMEMAKRGNDSMALLYAHQGLGIAFMQSERYAEAREHFVQVRDLARAIPAKQLEAEAMTDLASSTGHLGDWHAAELLLREAVALYRSVGVPFNIGHGLHSLAFSLRQQGMLTESLRALDEAIGIYERSPNKIGLWWSLNARSDNLQALGRFGLAKMDAERAYALAQQIDVLLYRSESARRMAAVSVALGEHKLAYQFSAQALELAGKVAREKANARVGELVKNYQNDSKQRKIDELNLLDQQRELEGRWLWTVLGGSFLVLVLTVGFLLRLRRSHRLLASTNEQLRLSQDEICALSVGLEQRVQERTDALRQQTRYLRTLIDALPVWLWLKDTEGRYLTVNVSIAALYGFTPQQMIGKTDAQLFPGDVAESFRATDIEVMQTRQRKTWEQAVAGKEGAVEWHEIDKVPVIDIDGILLGTVGIWRDITEHKQYELSLLERAELEQRQSQFFNVAAGFFYTTVRHPDGSYAIPFASSGIRELLGIEPEAVMQDSSVLFDAAQPDDREMAAHKREESERDLSPYHIEYRIMHPVNGLRWMEVHLLTQRLPDGGTRWDGFMHDITGRKRLEYQLAQRERDFRSLADNMPDNVSRWDVDGRYLYLNPVHERTLGVSANDMIGKAIPDSHTFVKAAIAQVVATGQMVTLVRQSVVVDGETQIHEVSLAPEFDDAGHVISVLGIGRDMTDIYRMRETIAEREREFRSLAENLPDNVVRWDKQGRYVYVNPTNERTIGARSEDVFGKRLGEAFPDGRFNPLETAIDQIVATGQGISFVRQPVPMENGEMRFHEVNLTPEFDDAGHVVSVLGIGRDMTDVYRMQEAIATREQEFRSLAESSPDFIVRYDREGRHLYFNDHLLHQVGLASADEAIGKRPSEVWPDGRFDELEQVVARAMESGNQGSIEIVEPADGGGFRYHQIFVVPERDVTGQVIGAIAFGREITAIREAEHKLAHFIDNLPGMAYTFLISPDGRGSFPYVSPAIDELYGLKPEDVKDDMAPIHALAHPDDRPRIEAAIAESARTMRPFQLESRICRKDEPERWIDVRSVPERQADGSLLWYGMMLDITERKRAQVELQRSEHELRRQAQFQQSLLSTLIDAGVVLCVVENGKFVYTNDHYPGCQLGYAKGQMPATVGFIDLIHPDDRPRIAEMYRNRLAGKPVPSSYEIGALAGDGSRLDYEFHVTTVPGTDPVQTLVFSLDITERKHMQEILRDSHRFLYNIIDTIADPIFVQDRQHLWLHVNDAFCRFIGHSREELVGKSGFDFFPEHEARVFWAGDEAVFASGQEFTNEEEFTNSRGETRYIFTRKTLFVDTNQQPLLVGVISDFTERKRMEDDLHLREQEFRTLAENAPDNIIRYDMAGRIIYVNPVLERTLGMPAASLLGTHARDNPSGGRIDAYVDTLNKVLASGEDGEIEMALPDTPDGPKVHHIRLVAEHNDAGDIVGVLAIGRDITELKRYEAARDAALAEAVRLAKTRSEFLAHMSHELRTPLNGILGYTQILQRDNTLGERDAAALNVIRQSGEHLLTLIEDILDLARIEAGRFQLDLSEMVLTPFLRGIVDIVSVKAREKGITFTCDFAHDLPASIRGDEKRLRQVLLNLLSNAVKFTERGGVVLQVSMGGGHLAFLVEDTGIGIAASELESIFQPFEQSGGMQQRFGGSGLGLSISRQLMRLMGSDIQVQSRLGAGSRFLFELELPEAEETSAPLLAASRVSVRGESDKETLRVDAGVLPLLLPPIEALQALHRLAQLGNMRDIIQYAQQIAEISPQYQPFTAQLRQLAQAYQSKAILAFINESLHDANNP